MCSCGCLEYSWKTEGLSGERWWWWKDPRSNLWVPITCLRADCSDFSIARRWHPGLESGIQKTYQSLTPQSPEWGTHSPPRSVVPHRAQCPAAIIPGCVGIGAALRNSETLKWAQAAKELGFGEKKEKGRLLPDCTQHWPIPPTTVFIKEEKTGYTQPQPDSSELRLPTSSHRFMLFSAALLLAWHRGRSYVSRTLHKQIPH